MQGEQGGIALDSFQVVLEFVARFREGTLAVEDRTVHGSQPLVLLAEATLESVSRVNLPNSIVGFNLSSAEQLTDQRRQFEAANEQAPLQLLLYSFERLCEVVHFAGYHSEGGDNDTDFFHVLFPDWLAKLTGWGTSEMYLKLASVAADARRAYLPVAGSIVP